MALSPETRAELRALARLAAPLALASAGQSLMNVVDAAVVGRAGAVPLAGVGLGSLLFFAISVGGMGVVMGLDPLVSQSLGAGDGARARHYLWQGAWLSLLIGAVLAVPLAIVPAVLGPIGIAPDVAAQASGHLLARIPGLPAFLFFYAARSYLQGSHAPRAVLAAAVLGNVVNLLLDLLLVFGGGGLPAWTGPLRSIPALGAVGSGIATTVATWAQALLVAWAAGQVPAGGTWARRPVPAEMRLAVKVGLPIGLHMLAEVGLFALVGLIAGRLGAVAMAAHQVALSLASFSFNAAVGIGNAGSVRVGWAVGAGDTRGARRAGLSAFGLGATLMASWGLAFLLFPGVFARLMSSDPAVVAATTPLLAVAGLFQVSDGIQAVGAGVLRGAGDTRFTLWANVIGHWALGFPAALGLGLALGWGVTGLWWGLLIGLTAVAIALFVRFRRIAAQDIVPLHARAPSAAPSASSPPPADPATSSPRLALPQPWEEVPHTADVGIAARGATPAEALSRLVLALGSLAAGGGAVREDAEEEIEVRDAGDLARTAVSVLREVHFRLAARGRIPSSCEVLTLAPGAARLRVGSGPRDPERHAEGADVKAVTWHAASLAPDGNGWRAQVILDV